MAGIDGRHRRNTHINSVLFFFVWLAILYGGADHPPPPWFIVVILLDLIAALLIYVRVPVYLDWISTRKKYRVIHVLLDGLAVGLAFALLAILFPGGGGPSVTRSMTAYLIWFIVLGVVGIVNALVVYFVNPIVARTIVKGKEV